MGLFEHIIFGLAIYPVAFVCFFLLDRIFDALFFSSSGLIEKIFCNGLIKKIFCNAFVFYALRVMLVAFWIYLGHKLALRVGLDLISEDSSATQELTIIYMLVWCAAVITLSVKAALKADDFSAKRDNTLNNK